MDFKDIKIGMKVVPIDKTIGGLDLEDSIWIKGDYGYPAGITQGFLYVVDTDTYGGKAIPCVKCWSELNDRGYQHTWLPEELIPYIEEPEEEINEPYNPDAFENFYFQRGL